MQTLTWRQYPIFGLKTKSVDIQKRKGRLKLREGRRVYIVIQRRTVRSGTFLSDEDSAVESQKLDHPSGVHEVEQQAALRQCEASPS